MWMAILYTIYFANCAVLIFFVLLQQSKGGGLAGAFGGGGGSDTLFGYTSMQKIGHYTIYAAVLFMLLSLFIANYPYQAKASSVVDFSSSSAAGLPPSTEGAQPAPLPAAAPPEAGAVEQPAAPGSAEQPQ